MAVRRTRPQLLKPRKLEARVGVLNSTKTVLVGRKLMLMLRIRPICTNPEKETVVSGDP